MIRALFGEAIVATMKTKKKAPAKKKATPKKKAAAPKRKAAAPKRKAAASKRKAAAAPKKKAASRPKPAARESLAMDAALLASPERVYAAWIDSGEHSEFTGGEAIIEAREGGKHSAWSGYIEGRFLSLDPGKKLEMTWRTTEFDESDPDSHLEVRFMPDGGGTRLELVHTNLPAGGAAKYTTGWREFYFVPMRKYFG
jgi:activator of HSP90 ATPase